MRKLAIKGGFLWVILAIMPGATIVKYIGESIELSGNVIVAIQMPLLVIQLLSLFMIIKYRKEIF